MMEIASYLHHIANKFK